MGLMPHEYFFCACLMPDYFWSSPRIYFSFLPDAFRLLADRGYETKGHRQTANRQEPNPSCH